MMGARTVARLATTADLARGTACFFHCGRL